MDCPSGKTGHPSQAAAHRAAIALAIKRTHTAMRAYPCPDCHRWHLTSSERLPTARTRRRRPAPEPVVATREQLDAWWAQHATGGGRITP